MTKPGYYTASHRKVKRLETISQPVIMLMFDGNNLKITNDIKAHTTSDPLICAVVQCICVLTSRSFASSGEIGSSGISTSIGKNRMQQFAASFDVYNATAEGVLKCN